jgi:hypothetical protein
LKNIKKEFIIKKQKKEWLEVFDFFVRNFAFSLRSIVFEIYKKKSFVCPHFVRPFSTLDFLLTWSKLRQHQSRVAGRRQRPEQN